MYAFIIHYYYHKMNVSDYVQNAAKKLKVKIKIMKVYGIKEKYKK